MIITHVKHKYNLVTTFIRNCSTINSLYYSNTKITSYFRCGDIDSAVQLFDKLPHKNLVTWNCMISGYVKNGKVSEARKVFDIMPHRNVVSWTAMLTGYVRFGDLEEARSLFDAIGSKNVVCWNAMLSGYVRCGRMREARELFDAMPVKVKNCVTWATMIEGCFYEGVVSEAEVLFDCVPERSVLVCNAMLAGYAEKGDVDAAYELFIRMPKCDVASWTSVIKCFLKKGELGRARGLFDDMPKKDIVVWTVMIRGYLDNNLIVEARRLFDDMPCRDVVTWNCMISGYVQNDMLSDALELFRDMPVRNIVSWNSILQGYVQQNDIVRAQNFFEKMPQKDRTSWNTMISGDQSEGAFVLYVLMLRTGLQPDQGTLSSIMSACGTFAVHGFGRAVHSSIVKIGYETDSMVTSTIISMYSKCGLINDSVSVFERMVNMDTVAWNAIIVAHAYAGSAIEALNLFCLMIQYGLKPDNVTFLGVLVACSHSGMVNEGLKYFVSMDRDWKLIPKAEHIACMIDLLGRSGYLFEAYELVKQIPVDVPTYTWEILLSSCRVHNNYALAERVMQKLSFLKRPNTGTGVLLSNIYAARGMWNDTENVRISMEHAGIKKELACSWIEMKGQIYRFVYRDKSHPQMENMKYELESLAVIMKEPSLKIH
ncbi:hypothetical protein DCAR_0728710 [Daucus carota subsp. sativus]|uniref:Uncharacterized protein n=1 Tax=Daucus carota subsp. sativus TaxID=79200 RepID=A0AAF0XLK8_DAUCS|nr:PREDICTED: pentatricopeptide repeat-containing protein At4g02750-like [Daucus carota subsp. sativus]XP_017215410.1 PREDICTED: pentatricopeptide repeat-containing protein At4g02750-like [Daucus carota subsp. sativus]WOH09254.1 hypothetical protein DCAR_0728710 [Daucus carota subsp. sativus]